MIMVPPDEQRQQRIHAEHAAIDGSAAPMAAANAEPVQNRAASSLG